MRCRGTGLLLASIALACTPKPDPAAVHRDAGDERYRKADYAAAAAEYQQSLAANPKQEAVWEKMAASRLRLDDRDGAAAALLRTLDFKRAAAPRAEVYRNVAGFYLQSPDRDKAEGYLLEVLKLEPDDDSTLSWLGEIEAERGGARSQDAPAVPEHLDGALRYYDRLIALRPESMNPYVHKRVVLAKYLGHLASRRQAVEQSLRWKKRGEQVDARARIAELQGRYDELAGVLEGVNRRIGELRRPRALPGS
jgi:tetratricopeptide (TPR) repeat protein